MSFFNRHSAYDARQVSELHDWVKDLRRRSHDSGNHIQRIEGEVLSLKIQLDERLKRVDEEQQNSKSEIKDLAIKVDLVGNNISSVRDELSRELMGVKESLTHEVALLRERMTKLDTKQLAAIGVMVFVAEKVLPTLNMG